MSTAQPGRKGKQARRGNPVGRTSELARKRERRSFRLKLLAFSSLILILLLAAVYQFWLRDSSLVAIKNLEVRGVTTKAEEGKQIDQAVRTAMGEMTTLNVQPELLEKELARFPRVEQAEIETSFPDSATVTLTIRQNGSIYGEGSDALLIASDGTVLGPAAGQEDSLPLIVDGDPPEPADGDASQSGEVLTGRALNQALVLGATPPELRTYVKQSVMAPHGVEVEFDNGLVILFGDSTHADEKWRAAAALIADPEFDTSSYVDLTVPRRPGVSPQDPTEVVPEEGLEDPSEEVATG